VISGTGTPRREFLHTHDLADALRFLLENYDSPQIINVGWGYDITVRELALLVAKVVGVDAERFRYVKTGRHTTEAPGYQSSPAIGLGTEDQPGRGGSGYLSMVFTEFGRSMLATRSLARRARWARSGWKTEAGGQRSEYRNQKSESQTPNSKPQTANGERPNAKLRTFCGVSRLFMTFPDAKSGESPFLPLIGTSGLVSMID
jgi:hypothetical protein